jgi:hypothetical protein
MYESLKALARMRIESDQSEEVAQAQSHFEQV